MANRISASQRIASRHGKFSSRAWMTSGNTKPPSPTPAMAMPSARPRRSTNQRDSSTAAIIGPISTLAGAMNSPKIAST